MRFFGLTFFTAVAACLSGCDRTPATSPVAQHGGRFLGIGVYQTSDLWQHMVAAARPADAAAARVADDSQVIVVVDSNSGEIRQCGNMSGHCISMNPWSAPLGRGQAAPIALDTHAEDLIRVAQEVNADHSATTAANSAAPAPVRRR